MKRKIAMFAGLLFFIAAGVSTGWRLRAPRSSGDLNAELQSVVSGLVADDASVKNCVVAVMAADTGFAWSGAAGIANRDARLPMRPDSPIYIASVTKLFTAAAIMRLYEQGAVSLDDPMAKYLPKELIRGINVYHGKDYSGDITIKELLSHRSGIADYYTDKAKDGKSLADLLVAAPERSWTIDQAIVRARDELKPHSPPGTDAYYSDTNFQLLGKIIETVTGKRLHVVFKDFFFHPLRLKHTWLIGRSEPLLPSAAPADVFRGDATVTKARSNTVYWADGGIVSTAEEMIVFLKALNDGRIVRRDTLERMHHWHKLRFPLQYGYGTMYFRLPWPLDALSGFPALWGHSGSTGSFLYYAEDLHLYIAGTIDQTESPWKPFRLIGKVMQAVESQPAAQRSAGRAPG
jgi:D-alanyl-D-alanine carboxypeptidase